MAAKSDDTKATVKGPDVIGLVALSSEPETTPKITRYPSCLATTWFKGVDARVRLCEQIIPRSSGSTIAAASSSSSSDLTTAQVYAISYLTVGLGEAFKYVGKKDGKGNLACYLSISSGSNRYYYQLGEEQLRVVAALKDLGTFRDLFLHGRDEKFLSASELREEIARLHITELPRGLINFYNTLIKNFETAGIYFDDGASKMEILLGPAVSGPADVPGEEHATESSVLTMFRSPIEGKTPATTIEQRLYNLESSQTILENLLKENSAACATSSSSSSSSSAMATKEAERPTESMALAGAYLSFFQAVVNCQNIMALDELTGGFMKAAGNFRSSHAHYFTQKTDPLTNFKLFLSHWNTAWTARSPLNVFNGLKTLKDRFQAYLLLCRFQEGKEIIGLSQATISKFLILTGQFPTLNSDKFLEDVNKKDPPGTKPPMK